MLVHLHFRHMELGQLKIEPDWNKKQTISVQVVSAEVCNSARTLCNSIAPVRNPSLAVLQVNNTGARDSTFTVTMESCDHPVVAAGPKTLSLTPGEVTDVVLQVLSSRLGIVLS